MILAFRRQLRGCAREPFAWLAAGLGDALRPRQRLEPSGAPQRYCDEVAMIRWFADEQDAPASGVDGTAGAAA
ncbi:hypothetical protein [Streptosporangium saharense]|uniref:hypothetical protein n=1 Tax=Streptosporangium saharense TaxID=1706840 RepID=UPI00344970D0